MSPERAIYSLKAENVVAAGAVMGASQISHTIWTKYFSSREKAQVFAQKFHGEQVLEWEEGGRSQDCGRIIYYIKKIEIQE